MRQTSRRSWLQQLVILEEIVFGKAYSAPYQFNESRSRQEVFDVQEETIVFINSEGYNTFAINVLVLSITGRQAKNCSTRT